MIKAFFYNEHMLKEINETFISSIPRFESTNHFKPINLCNICYKIVARILANRVKHLLNKIVCPLQGHLLQTNLLTIISC